MEFWHETGAIRNFIFLAFHPYVECPKRTSYVVGATKTSWAAPELRDGLELELFWASTLVTQIGLVLNLLHDLDNLVGLLLH